MIDFSDGMKADIKLLRRFLKEYFYTATPIARMDMKSQRIVEELFAVFMNDSKLLPMERARLSEHRPKTPKRPTSSANILPA